jgi:D-serine deaminase-like pyridoxal phosphate-dependent protein
MEWPLDHYALQQMDRIITPALLIYPDLVDANIRTTLKMLENNPRRWRPHIKTAKLAATIRRLMNHGVRNFKCATTLELLTACQAGAEDVVLAFAVTGANASRASEIAERHPKTRVSVLVESALQASIWRGSGIGVFLDVNPGMNRTGISPDRVDEILGLARALGNAFRGLHWYDGHISTPVLKEREAQTHEGYDHLMKIVNLVQDAGLPIEEVITSGTPTAPYGSSYAGFADATFVHRISPGTVVYNDMTSLAQLPQFAYQPAALVLSTVISHPLPNQITCDAGHKSVSADAGVPTCSVIGHPGLKPLKPSEEHLPIEGTSGKAMPAIGDKLYLIPRHVCPTVNNFDQALMVIDGRIVAIEDVTARGHESPLIHEQQELAV